MNDIVSSCRSGYSPLKCYKDTGGQKQYSKWPLLSAILEV